MNANDSSFSQEQVLLMREASMSAMSIGVGLTEIRRYRLDHHGYFYSGLQSFAFGVERLGKLIALYDYRLDNNGSNPGNNFFKREFGHDIDKLIKTAQRVNRKRGFKIDDSSLDDEIVKRIIPLLNDFADKMRYYNLNYLSGETQPGVEPLKRWDSEVASLILQRHYRTSPKRQLHQQRLAEALAGRTVVWFTAEDGSEINSVDAMLQHGDLIHTKQKYSMFYLHSIVHFLSTLFSELEMSGNFFPNLREYFEIFQEGSRRHFLNKKSWNPTPPFRF